MSHQAVTWAYEQDIKPSGVKFVLVTLANYATGDGYCYPGQGKLALDTGMNERHVRRCLAALEAAGLIYRRHRYDRHGKRTSDEFWLIGFKPLPDDIAASLADTRAGSLPDTMSGSDEVLPDISDTTTGHGVRDYRTSEPVPIRNINRQSEPSEEPSAIAPVPARANGASPRARQAAMFEAIYLACTGRPYQPGQDVAPRYRAKINTAIKDLPHATPDEVLARAAEYRVQYPGIKLTPNALANHWDELVPSARPTEKRSTFDVVRDYIAGIGGEGIGGDYRYGVHADREAADRTRHQELGAGLLELPDGGPGGDA